MARTQRSKKWATFKRAFVRVTTRRRAKKVTTHRARQEAKRETRESSLFVSMAQIANPSSSADGGDVVFSPATSTARVAELVPRTVRETLRAQKLELEFHDLVARRREIALDGEGFAPNSIWGGAYC